MSANDARKLKKGDTVRLKSDGRVFVVSGREDSGRVIYGNVNTVDGRPLTVSASDIRANA